MVTLVNRAKVGTTTTGTGTITLGPAKVGYQTFADAGVVDTNVVRYVIEDGPNWEIGTGTYTASGTTLSRTVTESSNSDSALNLTGFAVVFVGAVVEDLAALAPLASPALTGTPTAPTAAFGTDTTQVSSTAFVLANSAPLASPTFTGTPTAPTATFGTNTTQVATTAFVKTAVTPTVEALTPAATVDISLADDDYFTITLDRNTTFTMSNVGAGVDTFNLAITGFEDVTSSYDIANTSYDSVSFGFGGNRRGLFFKPDGTKMYVATGSTLYQYTLSPAWDVSTASGLVSFSVASQDGTANDIFFKPDGTKMFMLGDVNNSVFQYTLSTAYDLATASYDSVSFSVAPQEGIPRAVFLKPDGTEMYVLGADNDRVHQYNLSTAWVVSSASYDSQFSVTTQDNQPQDIFFKPDGTKMFMVGSSTFSIYQYTLSTAWDLSTASYDSISFAFGAQDDDIVSLFLNTFGTKLYIFGDVSNTVYEYSIGASSTATATYPASFKFPAGTTPTVSLDGEVNILQAQTTDGGTTFNVRQLGANFS
jgi:hypothetical protein